MEMDVSGDGIFSVLIGGEKPGSSPEFGIYAIDDFKSIRGRYVMHIS